MGKDNRRAKELLNPRKGKKMSRIFYVYVHTLKQDGRKYFGITCQKPETRWKNGNGYKGSTHIYNAIQKYGWEAFTHEILHKCDTLQEAYNYEVFYIAKYHTQDENFGFNCQSGGPNPKRHWKSNERQSKTRKGMKITGKALEHIQEAAKRRDNSVFSHPRSEETKRKISESHKGIPCSEKAKIQSRKKFSIPVLCVELNKKFSSMTDAADYFGLRKCTISAVINGRNKTAGGYHWKAI